MDSQAVGIVMPVRLGLGGFILPLEFVPITSSHRSERSLEPLKLESQPVHHFLVMATGFLLKFKLATGSGSEAELSVEASLHAGHDAESLIGEKGAPVFYHRSCEVG